MGIIKKEKYGFSGNLLQTITYEIDSKLDGERLTYAIDCEQDDIYLIIANRKKTEEEKKIGGMIALGDITGSSNIMYQEHTLESNNTDIYRLLVFDKFGKIKATKLLDVYVDNIKVVNNKLYVVDSHVSMGIYEYEVNFLDK